MTDFSFTVPIRTVSLTNRREHWAIRARRTKSERAAVGMFMRRHGRPLRSNEAASVTLTRIAPRLLDSDNLRSALKATRDAIAEALGLPDDRDGFWVTWEYQQVSGRPKEYAVTVDVVIRRAA